MNVNSSGQITANSWRTSAVSGVSLRSAFQQNIFVFFLRFLEERFYYPLQCSGSVTFWYGSGSSDPYFWPTDPDPALFVSDFKDANKNNFIHNHSSQIKSHKEIKNSRNQRFIAGTSFSWWWEGWSGSVPLTNLLSLCPLKIDRWERTQRAAL
jgi:hypothetical protein